MAFPDFRKEFVVSTDASKSAIGGVLSQMYEEGERPIAYFSRQTTKSEANYSSSELECLSLISCIRHWRCYLYGRHFKVITDHIALTYLLRVKDPSARLSRWALKLSEYTFTCVHKAGKAHLNADALSRAILGIDTVPLFTRENTLLDQKADQYCAEILKKIKLGKSEDFVLDIDGIVYKREDGVSKLLVPKAMINKIIFAMHDPPFAGHQNFRRTAEVIRRKYYWPGMLKDIEVYVSRCPTCCARKNPNLPKAPMALFETAQSVFSICSIDIVGPLSLTSNQNRYLLTFIDHYSRYAEAVAISEQSASIVANAFVRNVVLRHSAPQRLISDLGRNFISHLFQEVCKLLGISRSLCTPYKPTTNGLIERFHRTLADIISHYVDKNPRNWDMYVDYALAAYRNTKHSSTKQTPFYLMYGRDFRLPVAADLEFTQEVQPSINELRQKLDEAKLVAKQATERSRKQNKVRYDRNKKLLSYDIGDFVYYYQPAIKLGVASKFSRPWLGPYRIVEKLSDRNYVLKMGEKNITVFIDRIKPYRGVEIVEDSDKATVEVGSEEGQGQDSCGSDDRDNELSEADEDNEEFWMLAEPLIERLEIDPVETTNIVDQTCVNDLNESSEIEIDDHRDENFEPQGNVVPENLDGPAFRTRARARVNSVTET